MKSQRLNKLLAVFVCLMLFVTAFSGCTKKSPDTYKWKTRYEDERVWVEYENTDTESDEELSDNSLNSPLEDTNSPSDKTDSSISSEDNVSSEPEKQPGIDKNAKVDPADKPTVKNTANLMKPMSSKSDAQAETLRNKVLNAKSAEVKVTGKIYYISYRGNDLNDGLSPERPWKTLTKLSKSINIEEGDAVLFERGGVYRGGVVCDSGVYYGAYGEGDKPCIYRSSQNYANAEWVSEGNNVWRLNKALMNVGVIVFNHGEFAGSRKSDKAELAANGEFLSDKFGNLYLYMDTKPSSKYKSIEIGTNNHAFNIPEDSHDITIDNFTIKYTGAMGVRVATGVKNITITNCEIGWVGGSILDGYGDGTVRYGNGIEFWQACENVLVENNWIYQVYDSGFTHQGNSGKFVVKNLLLKGNLIEFCNFASVEYWAPAEGTQRMENIEYSGNIFRFAGYGREPVQSQPASNMHTTDNFNEARNFIIKDNIFDTALNNQVRLIHRGGFYPVLSGNTFIGTKGDTLGVITNNISTTTPFVFEDGIEAIIRTAWGDSTAKVIFKN